MRFKVSTKFWGFQIIVIFCYFGLVVTLGVLLRGVGIRLAKKLRLDREKARPFECGFNPKRAPRLPFSLRFFLVALVFLIFDVELILIFPLVKAISLRGGVQRSIIIWVFLILLFLALIHEINQGRLNWAN